MPETLPPLLLVGGGRMGQAMLASWLSAGLAPSVVIDPAPAPALRERLAGTPHRLMVDATGLDGFAPAAVVFAVKPQVSGAVLPEHAGRAAGSLAVSIMAGVTLGRLGALLGGPAALVRAMPNTPAAIGQGVTVACAAPGLPEPARALAERLLSGIGDFAWTADEGAMDAVTAVSGSGPAYVFLLAEAMERAAREQGLPPELARKLARRTVSGAGALLAASAEDAAALREGVTSPGGTTAAALAVLMAEGGLPDLLARAVAAAAARSRALAG